MRVEGKEGEGEKRGGEGVLKLSRGNENRYLSLLYGCFKN